MSGFTRAEFEAALDALEPMLANAFREVIGQITSRSQLSALQEAIVANDIEGAMQVLSMDSRIWGRLDAELANAFIAGGLFQVDALPKSRPNGGRLLLGFTGRHERAERWVREASSRLIVQIRDETREIVREVMRQGVEEGAGAANLARRLVGRRVNGQRQGGLVGLHSQFSDYVSNARRELSDPGSMANYLTRTRRDRRFDRTVAKVIREGRSLTASQVETITGRYADRLLSLRGETIARTEAISAFNAGRHEAVEQNIEDGVFSRQAVKKRWQATLGSRRTRDTHREMHGQTVQFGQAFVSSSGAQLRFPADTGLGAPAEEVIGCRCSDQVVVDWASLAQ